MFELQAQFLEFAIDLVPAIKFKAVNTVIIHKL